MHGSAPDIAGRNLANPMALILSAVLMLRHLDMNDIADRLRGGLIDVVRDGTKLTRDVGGTANTTEFTEAVARAIEEQPA